MKDSPPLNKMEQMEVLVNCSLNSHPHSQEHSVHPNAAHSSFAVHKKLAGGHGVSHQFVQSFSSAEKVAETGTSIDTNKNTNTDKGKGEREGGAWSMKKRKEFGMDLGILSNEAAGRTFETYVRLLPLSSEHERSMSILSLVDMREDGSTIEIVRPDVFDSEGAVAHMGAAAKVYNKPEWARSFTTRGCFSGSNNLDLYNNIGQDLVDNVLNGLSACFFAYGAKGTGKTYSLYGRGFDIDHEQDLGLVRTMGDVVEIIARSEETMKDTTMTISGVEICNSTQKIRDIFAYGDNDEEVEPIENNLLKIREHSQFGPYIPGLTKIPVSSKEEVYDILEQGHKRKIGNSSHTLLTLELRSSRLSKKSLKSSKSASESEPPVCLHLVELASSDDKFAKVSLSTLSHIISHMEKGGLKSKALPFRDSPLTFLLRDTLLSRSHTVMLGTVSAAPSEYAHSLGTLKFLDQWNNHIKVKVKVNHSVQRESSKTHSVMSTKDSDENEGGLENEVSDDAISYTSAMEKINHGLGASQLGSAAARTLLQATISDPRQKFGQVRSSLGSVNTSISTSSSSSSSSSRDKISITSPQPPQSAAESPKHIAIGDTASIQVMKNEIRQLHGQYIESQLELQALRTDHDSLVGELECSKKDAMKQFSAQFKENQGESGLKLRQAENEVKALQAALQEKEEMIETISEDLNQEREDKYAVEKSAEKQIKECIKKFEFMHGRIKELETQKQIEQIEVMTVTEIANMNTNTNTKEASIQVQVVDANDNKNENEKDKDKELENLMKLCREKDESLNKFRAEIQQTTMERESLHDAFKTSQEKNSLKDNEIEKMRAELDNLFKDNKEKSEALKENNLVMDNDFSEVEKLNANIQELKVDKENLKDLVVSQKMEVEKLKSKAKYWENLASKQKEYIHEIEKTVCNQLTMPEVRLLHEKLNEYQADNNRLRKELTASQTSMNQEYTDLWKAVQEMNELDSNKEAAITNLVSQNQKDKRKVAALDRNFRALQKELQQIDADLLETAAAKGILIDRGTPQHAVSSRVREVIGLSPRSPYHPRFESNAEFDEDSISKSILHINRKLSIEENKITPQRWTDKK